MENDEKEKDFKCQKEHFFPHFIEGRREPKEAFNGGGWGKQDGDPSQPSCLSPAPRFPPLKLTNRGLPLSKRHLARGEVFVRLGGDREVWGP